MNQYLDDAGNTSLPADIFLSFIMPAYNCEAYIEETIDSVLSQLAENCELIVVDDGSSDGTCRILKRMEKHGENIRIESCSHKGASEARNRGIELAAGEYVTFIDCDDCLAEGFVSQSLRLAEDRADLYIFGIRRCLMDGSVEERRIRAGSFPEISDFADEYIRKKNLLIYSNCNKFYRRDIINKYNIRFKEGTDFGEDRLFNYEYLPRIRSVITSGLIMLDYMQRNAVSMSTKHVPGFYALVRKLHEEKMKCFLALSKGTGRAEREAFVNYDMRQETVRTIERFRDNPEEEDENLPQIAELIYGDRLLAARLKEAWEVPDPSAWKHKPCENSEIAEYI